MQLEKVAIQTAAEIAGKAVPFSGPLVEALLLEYFEVQDEQLLVLHQVDDNVQRLVEGPWQAGRLRLGEARLPGRTPNQRRKLLTDAANCFRDAIPLLPDDSFSQAQAYVDLAITLALLGDREGTRHYAELGYFTARRAIWATTQKCRMMGKPSERRTPQLETLRNDPVRQYYITHVMSEAERDRIVSLERPLTRVARARLASASKAFTELELAAAALWDTDACEAYPLERDTSRATWPDGAVLDHFYLRRQYRLNQMCGRLDVLDEFWDAPREVIMSPKRPDLSPIPQTPTAAEREANPAYWEEAFWE